MHRNIRWFVMATLAFMLSFGGLIAQPRSGPGEQGPKPLNRSKLVKCLSILDLNEAQKIQIREILEASRAASQALREESKQAREALREAVGSNADDCTIGAAFREVHSSRETVLDLRGEMKEDIAAVLTEEQSTKLSGCLEAPGRRRE